MQPVLRILLSRWSVSFVGTALLAGLFWTYAPLLPELEGFAIRLVLVLVMVLLWAVANLLLELRQRGRDTALTTGLTANTEEEAAALGDKLTKALQLLQRANRSKGYLYEQPWYAIIGPPGAGKTTALLNAGLHFPLAAEMGQAALSGVGGTRLCEWWFTDDAVLIDTAGRYTTQDSDAAVDRAGWDAFLELLKRTRPRQPLNGVIVAIAIADIAQAPAAERAAHAKAVRARVQELQTRLGMRMPVYALFTKADLIVGFTQFFDDLDEAQRAQVWGTTFAIGADPAKGFAPDFRALLERLNQRMFVRLQAEPNPDRRAQIALFPTQVATLEQPLLDFVQAAFGATRTDPAPLLRGVYFTSGTQEGTPIDRLIGTMSRSFGLDQRRAPAVRPGQGRSFFLGRLLREVIFGEAMLVSRNPAALRRRRTVRATGFALAGLVVVAAGGLAWRVQAAGQSQIDAAAAALAGYEQAAQAAPLDPVRDADPRPILALLEQARALAGGIGTAPPAWWTLGLSQDRKLAAAAHAVYRQALERALLPRLALRLEAQLRDYMGQPDLLYEAARVYLMLGSAGPLDRELVHEWMRLDWQAAYPGDELAAVREALLRHLDALLAEPLPAISLDGALIAQARGAFAGESLSSRAYSAVEHSAVAHRLGEWKPSDALGAAGVGLFLRTSGKKLSDGLPGFFTADGFRTVLLPSLDSTARRVASESWVFGRREELDPGGPKMRALEREVIALYETDFIREWNALLADLNVAPMKSVARAAQDLYILASPELPMRALLVSIARQLRLGGAQAAPTPAKAAPAPGSESAAEQLQALLKQAPTGAVGPATPGQEIDERYKDLLKLVGDGLPGAPLDEALKSLIDIQQQTAKLAAAPVGTVPPPPAANDPAIELRREAATRPDPLNRSLIAIAQDDLQLRGGPPAPAAR